MNRNMSEFLIAAHLEIVKILNRMDEMRMTEVEKVIKALQNYLHLKNIPYVLTRPVGQRGAADIIACRDGKFLAIECKVPDRKLSEDQQKWRDEIEKAGGQYFFANDLIYIKHEIKLLKFPPK